MRSQAPAISELFLLRGLPPLVCDEVPLALPVQLESDFKMPLVKLTSGEDLRYTFREGSESGCGCSDLKGDEAKRG